MKTPRLRPPRLQLRSLRDRQPSWDRRAIKGNDMPITKHDLIVTVSKKYRPYPGRPLKSAWSRRSKPFPKSLKTRHPYRASGIRDLLHKNSASPGPPAIPKPAKSFLWGVIAYLGQICRKIDGMV